MFGIEPLARIVRHDARIEVKVPAAKGKKAYSYFREGGEGEKKSSGVGKKVALVGGGLALAGLGAAAIVMSRKKTDTKRSEDGFRGNNSSSSHGPQSQRAEEKNSLGLAKLNKTPKLVKRIGSGDFGDVHMTESGTAFKKVIGGEFFNEQEISIAYRAGKAGIAPKILGFQKSTRGITGFEMEYLKDYKTLEAQVRGEKNKKDFASTSKRLDNALIAVAKIHDLGIIHGDLHSMNIMQKDGVTKVIDFGIASEFKDKNRPSDIELERWSKDIDKFFRLSFLDSYGKRDEKEPLKNIVFKTPVQTVFKETLELKTKDQRVAYDYYKKEMKRYV